MTDPEPVDAATYADHLERLDRIGREALAADPAEAIQLVREANDLVAELLPMHRRLMDELAHHRSTLQAACDELVEAGTASAPAAAVDEEEEVGAEGGRRTSQATEERLDRLEGLGDDGDAPF